ncbi:MAG TPA: ATP-grasp domain-containing protein [Thermoanaerobaculia bacterium]|jgi:D-alanine-D-alanine ligase|nr:ATP-grasp domain-containing protein [Thermoanaerobaculia bacterium]
MKVVVLYNTFEGYEEYPGANLEPKSKKKKKKKTDIEAIGDALRDLGHEASTFAIDGRSQTLTKLNRTQADLFFNLVESYAGDDTMEMHFAAYLDLIGKRYTGAGPQGSYLAMDKSVAKMIMRYHELYTPYSAVVNKGRVEHAQDIRFPVIVKPAAEDASKGIDAASVVNSLKELLERIAYVHEEFQSPALLEEYIEGREIYAAVIGNEKPEALPLVELDLSKLPENMPKIAGYEVKFDVTTEAYKVTKSAPARNLDEETTERIQQTAVTAFRALKLRDYARIDLRLAENGKVYVIEANPNPWLDPAAEFAMAAKESGRSYTQTIGEIVELAMARG